jgi:uncharacterized protein YciI
LRVPAAEARPYLAAHRNWVLGLRSQGIRLSSGYLVDWEGRPGGGGLLLLEAADYVTAETLIRQDPMLLGDCVEWRLHRWVGAAGDLGVV